MYRELPLGLVVMCIEDVVQYTIDGYLVIELRTDRFSSTSVNITRIEERQRVDASDLTKAFVEDLEIHEHSLTNSFVSSQCPCPITLDDTFPQCVW